MIVLMVIGAIRNKAVLLDIGAFFNLQICICIVLNIRTLKMHG